MNLSAEALRIAALKILADDETCILNDRPARRRRGLPALDLSSQMDGRGRAPRTRSRAC